MTVNGLNSQALLLPMAVGNPLPQSDPFARLTTMVPVGQIGRFYRPTENPEESDRAADSAYEEFCRNNPGFREKCKRKSASQQRAEYNERMSYFRQGYGRLQNPNQMQHLLRILIALLQGQNSGLIPPIPIKPQNLQKDVNEGKKEFDTVDANGDGELSKEECITNYIRAQERALGKQIKKGSPDYLKFYAEAENIFNALSEKTTWWKEPVITKATFEKFIKYLDRADGSLDGKFDAGYSAQIIDKIKESGGDVEISAGKTLKELINMEA